MKVLNYSVDFCISLPVSDEISEQELINLIKENLACYLGEDESGIIWDVRCRKTFRPVPNLVQESLRIYQEAA
ncbi:MAG: hypothetical protein ACRC2S_16315 [Waterburya sp.]